MKVGTDSVMLGAWCSVENVNNILDIGAGTGIIALMAAQRSTASIDTVEIDLDAFHQANDNIQESEFTNRIRVIHADFIEFAKSCTQLYDVIISNPPYFEEALKPKDIRRSIARHAVSLGLRNLIEQSANLLNERGRLSIIIPKDKENQARQFASGCGLIAARSLSIQGQSGGQYKRILLEWSNTNKGPEIANNLNILDANRRFSPAYVELTRDFYLDF